MKALVYTGPKSIEIRDVPRPEKGPDQALIRVKYCGVCGTDIGIWGGTHPRATAPLVLGHEFVGTVTEASARFAVGQRVVAYPLFSCGTCHACRTGSPHVCAALRLIGIDSAGGMAEYLAVNDEQLCAVPADLDDKVAALIEPLAVVLRGVEQSEMVVGDHVVVLGAGPIGLLTALVARHAGAREVVVTDVNAARLALAADLGFATVDVGQADLNARILERTGGDGADVVFECAGVPASILDATQITRPRGTICLMSMHKGASPVRLLEVAFKELRLVGSRVYTQEQFRRAVALAGDLSAPLLRLVTQVIGLAEAGDVFDKITAPDSRDIKILLECS